MVTVKHLHAYYILYTVIYHQKYFIECCCLKLIDEDKFCALGGSRTYPGPWPQMSGAEPGPYR